MEGYSKPILNVPKTVRAWYMYDWANSVYSLVISSAIFPIYFNAVAVTSTGNDLISFWGINIKNEDLYAYALSTSFLIVAAILPILSGVADYTGNKKIFMKVFVFIGSFACIGLYFFRGLDTLEWGLVCGILASIGYSGSLVFYDAYLPEIVTKDRYDFTSAKGYSMGYYGSVILMVICVLVINNHEVLGFVGDPSSDQLGDTAQSGAVRFGFLLVGVWWFGFSMITFKRLPDNPYGVKHEKRIWVKGYEELRKVWISLKSSPNLKRYLIAFFFFNMGVQTVMYMASFFGEEVIGLPGSKLILIILLIQVVGSLGAWLFARISRFVGNLKALLILISIWALICVGAFYIQTAYQFYALAVVVGLVMGGIQSLARATYSKLIPASTIDHASYFSFYDVTWNLSVVVGTFSYGLIDNWLGSMRYSALTLGIFFLIGMQFLLTVKSGELEKQIR